MKNYSKVLVSRRRLVVVFVVALAVCLTLGSLFWSDTRAQNNSVEPRDENPQKSTEPDSEFSRLMRIAVEKGTVRVIIGLRIDFKPVGDLSPQDRARQMANIKNAQEDLLRWLDSYNVKNVKQFEYIPYLAAEVDAEALEKMGENKDIVSIHEDQWKAVALAESIPLIGVPAAWTAGFSGNGWAVAIIDSGVDKNHSFLSGKVVSEACYSSNFPADGVSSVCPGGVTQSTAANSGLHCNTAIFGCNHGTHVAGIAAGRGTSFNGVAKDANIIAIQVFSRVDNPAICGGLPTPCALTTDSDYTKGLERVFAIRTSFNIASANMSLGGGQFFSNCDASVPLVKAAIDNLRSVGIATVVASGNNSFTNSIASPACISSAVSVGNSGDGSFANGSTAALNQVMSDSNSASFLSLLAPGRWIFSSLPNNMGDNFNGTSMAAPHVAGGWAVLKQKKPTATVTEILNAFTSTGLPITDSRNGIVKPRIRVDAALNAISGTCTYSLDPTSRSFAAASASSFVNVNTQSGCSWSATVNAPALMEIISPYERTGLFALAPTTAYTEIAASSAVSAPTASFPGTGVGSIPDGLSGTPPQYGAPLNISFAVSGITAPVSSVSADVTLGHTWVGDVDMVLKAPGGSPSQTLVSRIGVTTAGSFGSASDYNGNYNFTDTASGTNIWTAAAATPVPPGIYRTTASGQTGQTNPAPVTNLTATFTGLTTTQINGTWTLTVRDAASADIGSVSAANLNITGASGGTNWVNLTSPSSGTGSATINYNVNSNPSANQRTGTITVNGQQVHTINQSGTGPPATKKRFDFDGDLKSDISVFRPSNGQWWINRSLDGETFATTFGVGTDKIVPADYTGDGKTDVAVWRPSNGNWLIMRSDTQTSYAYAFGVSTDIPAPGDFDGDGKADIAVFRGSNGFFYIARSSDNQIYTVQFGVNGDIPVIENYDGDTRDDVAIYRPSNGQWWLNRSTAGVIAYQFGASGDKPVPGDYTGDGKADVAVWRPGNPANWFILRSESPSYYSFPYGLSTDIPAPGDFDGDGKYDATVFRPSTTLWYILRSQSNTTFTKQWGANGDKPVPNAFIP